MHAIHDGGESSDANNNIIIIVTGKFDSFNSFNDL